VDRDVTTNFFPGSADDRGRRARIVGLLAVGVARLLASDAGGANPAVDLSADVRVTTATARPGGGDES
jgi:hypothetical protein